MTRIPPAFAAWNGLWIRAAAALAVTTACATTLASSDTLPIKAMWLSNGLVAVVVGYLLFPGALLARFCALRRAATWALIVGAVAAIGLSVGAGRVLPWPALAGVFALTFFACAMTQLVQAVWPKVQATPLVLLALPLVTTLPIVMGPTLEQMYDATRAANVVVLLSPASYLAALLEYDYLRSEWFYDHTPFGALRYDYPAPITSTLLLLSVGVLLCWAAGKRQSGRIQVETLSFNSTPSEDSAS